MTSQQRRTAARRARRDNAERHRVHLGLCWSAMLFTTVGIFAAPPAMASSADSLRAAVTATRGASCAPLRSDPVIDQAADGINKTTDSYINHTSRTIPDNDALPLLKDLGYGGSKAAILSGAGADDGTAIKGLLLEGWATIPDCSYTDFGVSALYNAKKDLLLMTVVLAAK
jgi:hypothetical protein